MYDFCIVTLPGITSSYKLFDSTLKPITLHGYNLTWVKVASYFENSLLPGSTAFLRLSDNVHSQFTKMFTFEVSS